MVQDVDLALEALVGSDGPGGRDHLPQRTAGRGQKGRRWPFNNAGGHAWVIHRWIYDSCRSLGGEGPLSHVYPTLEIKPAEENSVHKLDFSWGNGVVQKEQKEYLF